MERDTQLQKIISESVRYEENLLGWLLSGNASFGDAIEVVERLHLEELYSDKNKLVYGAIRLGVGEGIDPSITGILHYLKQFDVRGTVQLDDLSKLITDTDIFTFGLAKRALELIKTLSLQRRLVQFHAQRAEEAKKTTDLKSFIAQDAYELLKIEEGYGQDKQTSARDIGKNVLEKAQYNLDNNVLGIKTGFSIDHQLGGFFPGHTWILGAYTGTGKTFVSLNMALNVLRQAKSTAFFSTEMSRDEIYLRLAGSISRKSAKQLETGNHQADLIKAIEYLDTHGDRLHIYDDVFNFEDLRLKCKKQKLKHGLDVFFIDFMQNMRGEGSIYERMSTMVVQIQQLAKELQATAVILSQISNENAKEKSDVLNYKGAGEIAQVADVGLWLEKAKDTYGNPIDGGLKLIVRKSRHSASNLMCDLVINFQEGGRVYERRA